MSLNAELLVKMGRFLAGEQSFADLVNWVQDHEEHWAKLPAESAARSFAGTIMLAAYEVDDGVRDPDSVRELISEASLTAPTR